MKQNNSISDTKNLVLCAVCAAITCVLAPLSIPLAGGVPISLATFAVMLAGVLLGGSLGALSQLIYVLLGAVGLPVFAGWTGGLGNVLGMTGGFIIGYIPCAWLTGLIYKKFGYTAKKSAKILFMIIGMVVGTLCMTVFGSAFNAYYLIPKFSQLFGMPLEAIVAMGTAINSSIKSVGTLVLYAVVPFNILKGVVDSILTYLLYKRLEPILFPEAKQKQNRPVQP